MTTIEIKEEPIELYKVLKLANWASSGGEAKWLISDGQVQLNAVTETQKRKKIHFGDTVSLGGNTLTVRQKQG